MWVADMDFMVPPAVIEAAEEFSRYGVFGYTFRPESSLEAFAEWCQLRYDWRPNLKWMTSSPGIVTALSLAVDVFSSKGDKIMISTPVYPPFHSIVKDFERELVPCDLYLDAEGRYTYDFDAFEKQLATGVKMYILCNSHNPVGRVWTKEELTKIGELCLKHGVLIFSDEIHCDLALYGNKHTVMASISEEISAITITAMAPSKTFNIAGMMNSVMVISNDSLRSKFNKILHKYHLELGNVFAHMTMEAAYRHGGEWLDLLKQYLEGNIDYTYNSLKSNLPTVTFFKPEGSFLLWLDFRQSGLSHKELYDRLINVSKVGLNDGLSFGLSGEGFMRMNIGTQRAVLEEGLNKIITTFNSI
jgi:cystathionine beta-lyase